MEDLCVYSLGLDEPNCRAIAEGEASHPGPAGSRRTQRKRNKKIEPLVGLVTQLIQLLMQFVGGAQGLGNLEPGLQKGTELLGSSSEASRPARPKPKKKMKKKCGESADKVLGVGTRHFEQAADVAKGQLAPGKGKGKRRRQRPARAKARARRRAKARAVNGGDNAWHEQVGKGKGKGKTPAVEAETENEWVKVARKQPDLREWKIRSKGWQTPCSTVRSSGPWCKPLMRNTPTAMLAGVPVVAALVLWRDSAGQSQVPGECQNKTVLQKVNSCKLGPAGCKLPQLMRCNGKARRLTTRRSCV